MNRSPALRRRLLTMTLMTALLSTIAVAESHNPSDYPLRIHVYKFNAHEHFHHGVLDWVEGEGRANLFENGDPKGIDFAYNCGERFMASSGGETYPAKWKKQGQSIVILMHKIGSTSSSTCEFKVDVKDFAYYSRDGSLSTEPIAVFKQWMIVHHYDPEHGFEGSAPTSAPKPSPTADPAPPATPPPS